MYTNLKYYMQSMNVTQDLMKFFYTFRFPFPKNSEKKDARASLSIYYISGNGIHASCAASTAVSV